MADMDARTRLTAGSGNTGTGDPVARAAEFLARFGDPASVRRLWQRPARTRPGVATAAARRPEQR